MKTLKDIGWFILMILVSIVMFPFVGVFGIIDNWKEQLTIRKINRMLYKVTIAFHYVDDTSYEEFIATVNDPNDIGVLQKHLNEYIKNNSLNPVNLADVEVDRYSWCVEYILNNDTMLRVTKIDFDGLSD